MIYKLSSGSPFRMSIIRSVYRSVKLEAHDFAQGILGKFSFADFERADFLIGNGVSVVLRYVAVKVAVGVLNSILFKVFKARVYFSHYGVSFAFCAADSLVDYHIGNAGNVGKLRLDLLGYTFLPLERIMRFLSLPVI